MTVSHEGAHFQIPAVVVAEGLLAAGDQEVDPVAPVARHFHRRPDRNDRLAALGVIDVADPRAIAAHVAAEKSFGLRLRTDLANNESAAEKNRANCPLHGGNLQYLGAAKDNAWADSHVHAPAR